MSEKGLEEEKKLMGEVEEVCVRRRRKRVRVERG